NERDGDVTLRKALERSNNVVAVKLLSRVGIEPVIENAHRLGIQSPLGANLSLALGSSEVTPLELASAYSVFAADGMRCEPQAYSVVEDRAGMVVERNDPRPVRVFDADPIRTLNDVMMGVVRWGTGAAANIGRPAAGKTGTTSDHRDAWFVGYTPDLVGLVWVGNDDNSKMVGGTTGGGVCAPLWGKLMSFALNSASPSAFPLPKEATVPKAPKAGQASRSTGVTDFYVPGGDADPAKKPKITLPDPESVRHDGDAASSSSGADGDASQILQDMQ
ncbi:MAG TPA: penicillin-binding transpeptidase domain-containing protein, partial [Stenomitos sp.]